MVFFFSSSSYLNFSFCNLICFTLFLKGNDSRVFTGLSLQCWSNGSVDSPGSASFLQSFAVALSGTLDLHLHTAVLGAPDFRDLMTQHFFSRFLIWDLQSRAFATMKVVCPLQKERLATSQFRWGALYAPTALDAFALHLRWDNLWVLRQWLNMCRDTRYKTVLLCDDVSLFYKDLMVRTGSILNEKYDRSHSRIF